MRRQKIYPTERKQLSTTVVLNYFSIIRLFTYLLYILRILPFIYFLLEFLFLLCIKCNRQTFRLPPFCHICIFLFSQLPYNVQESFAFFLYMIDINHVEKTQISHKFTSFCFFTASFSRICVIRFQLTIIHIRKCQNFVYHIQINNFQKCIQLITNIFGTLPQASGFFYHVIFLFLKYSYFYFKIYTVWLFCFFEYKIYHNFILVFIFVTIPCISFHILHFRLLRTKAEQDFQVLLIYYMKIIIII